MQMNETSSLLAKAETLIQSSDWYERAEIDALERLLDHVKIFVDVGSSIGPYTEKAVHTLRNARIFAIEPHPEAYEALRGKMQALSDVCAARGNSITTLHAAVADVEGTTAFYCSNLNVLQSALTPIGGPDQQPTSVTKTLVEAVTLDGLFPDTPPDFVKVDVEGAEWRVLKGSETLLRRGHTKFLVEVHPWGDPELGKKPSDVIKLMTKKGYALRRVHRHWLFEPRKLTALGRVKAAAYASILDRPALRKICRRIVEASRRPVSRPQPAAPAQ
jgi:FkbM family methyltransferase